MTLHGSHLLTPKHNNFTLFSNTPFTNQDIKDVVDDYLKLKVNEYYPQKYNNQQVQTNNNTTDISACKTIALTSNQPSVPTPTTTNTIIKKPKNKQLLCTTKNYKNSIEYKQMKSTLMKQKNTTLKPTKSLPTYKTPMEGFLLLFNASKMYVLLNCKIHIN